MMEVLAWLMALLNAAASLYSYQTHRNELRWRPQDFIDGERNASALGVLFFISNAVLILVLFYVS